MKNTGNNKKRPSGKKSTWQMLLGVLVVIVFLFFGGGSFLGGNTEAEKETAAQIAVEIPAEAENAETIAESSETVTLTESEGAGEISDLPADTEAALTEAEIQELEERQDYYFRNQKLLNQHYEKHGIEMGFASAEAYEAAASDVINDPQALSKEKSDGSGDYAFFIEKTKEFVVLSYDGYIRTYFIPGSGLKYYNKQ